MLVCYVSGHGFGHAVRTIEVVNALRRKHPGLPVAFRTPIARWLLEFNLSAPFTLEPVRLDVGAIQTDSLSIDARATLRAYQEIEANADGLIAGEVAALRALGATLILADIPALAFDVAHRLGIPAVALTNFSWDWIYADFARAVPEFDAVVERLRASYARATLLLRLPLHGDLSAFPRIRDVPFVARRATMTRAAVRRRLDLPANDRLVLLSFGGLGLDLRQVPAAPPGVTFVSTEAGPGALLPPCRTISRAAMQAAGVHYQDVVGAVDAVMTKPGYGIVAECIANGTPMIYTSRGRFVEYDCLVEGVQRHLTCAFISNDDLYAGRWADALEDVFAQPRRRPEVATNGADVVAETLHDLMEG